MGEVSIETAPRSPGLIRSPAGYLLAVLLAGLLLTAAACPRDPEGLFASEVTHLAAAQSLVHDLDWRFGEADRQRLDQLGLPTDDLLLRPAESPADPSFDLPAVYPVVLAPFVWLAPLRGPAILNVILLGLTVVAAATRLGQRMGREALVVILLCVFASVMYRSVFLVSPVMLLAACVALAFQIAFRHEEPASHGIQDLYRPPETSLGSGAGGLGTGILLGLISVHHLMFLLLALPAILATPVERRRTGLAGLTGGLALVLAASSLTGGLWGVPFGRLADSLMGSISQISVGLSTWNLLYFFVGRNLGLLAYLLPAVALIGLWKGGAGRSVLVVTAIVGGLAPVVLSPFDFSGGPAAIGNAWLVPWFVLLWFVPTRPLPPGWLIATALLAIPGMYPTWLAPSIEPVTPEGIYRHAAGRFHHHLRVETTQKALPPGEVMGNRFWIRSLSLEARVSGSSRWILAGEGWTEMQLAAPTELAAIHLQFGPQAEAQLEVRGADLGDMVLLPNGGVGFRLENLSRRALHPMWWSRAKHFNYVLQFRMPMEEPRAQTLTITAIAADLERTKP